MLGQFFSCTTPTEPISTVAVAHTASKQSVPVRFCGNGERVSENAQSDRGLGRYCWLLSLLFLLP